VRVDTRSDESNADLDDLLGESRLVVSVQNDRVAGRAARHKVPCVYVDSLLWMWERPPVPMTVSHCFVERFPGVDRQVQRWRRFLPQTSVIGPTIAAWDHARPNRRSGVLVNFGGLSAWHVPHETLVAYAVAMTECVVTAFETWPGAITVAVGRHVLDDIGDLPPRLARADIRFQSLDHNQYLRALQQSRLLVSSAGMHAMYEAFASGVPCILLPSQNLSGAHGLRRLAEIRVTSALDWDTFYGLRYRNAEEEALACAEIAVCIGRFTVDERARRRLVEYLRFASSGLELDRLAAAQTGFFRRMGRTRGSLRVAEYVSRLLGA
jgi:hypothetical protein